MQAFDPSRSRGFKLLGEQAQDLRAFAANPKQRSFTGMKGLDYLIGGIAAGEIFTFCGRSHVGKSLVATNIMANNPDLGIVFFSLEMPFHQVLQNLYGHITGTPSQHVGRMVRSNSLPSTMESVFEDYDLHVVVEDDGLTLDDMGAYLKQYEAYYGQRPDLVIIDYLEEIAGGKRSGEGWIRTEATASMVKGWSKSENIPVYLLHQSNKSEKPWEPVTEDSPKGGGYTESDVLVGLWRPARDPELEPVERYIRRYEVRFNVLKNRVSYRLTEGKDIVMRIAEDGRLVDMNFDEVKGFWD